jgi:hypothetical protein
MKKEPGANILGSFFIFGFSLPSTGEAEKNHRISTDQVYTRRTASYVAHRNYKLRIPTFGKVGRVRALRSGASVWASALRVGAFGGGKRSALQRSTAL